MSAVFPVADDPRWRQHDASAGQTTFPINYVFQDVADITIEKIAADGTVSTLTYPNDYAISGAGNPAGGNYTLVTPAQTGEKYRSIGTAVGARTQSIVRSGRYSSGATDDDLDRALIRDLEMRRDLTRAWKSDFGAEGKRVDLLDEGHGYKADATGNLVDAGLALYLPPGGGAGQVPVKDGPADGQVAWQTLLPLEGNALVAGYANRADAQAAKPLATIQTVRVRAPSGHILSYRYDPGGTALTTADGRKWSPDGDIHPDHFGENADPGATDTRAHWAAALSWAGRRPVIALPLLYRTTDTVEIVNDGQKIDLTAGASILLDTVDASRNAVKCTGAKSRVKGGMISTTLRTLSFLVGLYGAGASVAKAEIFFAARSTNPNMVYNHGGVEMRGERTSVRKCEIYNMEGIGVAIYAPGSKISCNYIHDNICGIHGDRPFSDAFHLLIQNNDIEDNDVNNAQGADGILCGGGFIAQIIGNHISGSGEHGMYCYARNAVVTSNVVTGNTTVGIKIRDCHDTVVSANSVYSNNTSGTNGQSEIYIQCTLQPVQRVQISNNAVVSTSGQGGIRSVFGAAGYIIDNLLVSNNTVTGDIDLAFTTKACVWGNVCTGNITVGASGANAPNPQTGAFVFGNRCAILSQGRCGDSYFGPNMCDSFSSGSNNTGNRYLGIRAGAQATTISRRSFTDMLFCAFDLTALGGTSFLTQGANAAENSYKNISHNRFKNAGQRVIDDSTSGVSGSYNILHANFGSGAATPMFSLWGAGHSLVGNVNPDGGGTGFVGMNNSWMIGNSPKVGERSGTSGNQNI